MIYPRLRIDLAAARQAIRAGGPKIRGVYLAAEVVRAERTLDAIIARTKMAPFLFDCSADEIEISTDPAGDNLRTLKLPTSVAIAWA